MSSQIAKVNYQFCQETIALKQDIETRFLELGRRLYEIQEKRRYEHAYETFELFCLELKMSRATVSKLMNIYVVFVLTYDLPVKQIAGAGGWSEVAEVLPYVKSKRDAVSWLNRVRDLSRDDLRIMMRERKTGIEQADCKHDKDFYTLRICRTCGFKEVTKDSKK